MGFTIGAMLEEIQGLYKQHFQPCFLYLSSEVIKVWIPFIKWDTLFLLLSIWVGSASWIADIWFRLILCKLFEKFDWITLSEYNTSSHKYSGMASRAVLSLFPSWDLPLNLSLLDPIWIFSAGIYCQTRYSRWLFFVGIKVHSLLSTAIYAIWSISIISRLLYDWDHSTA